MLTSREDCVSVEAITPLNPDHTVITAGSPRSAPFESVRSSLRASTIDGIFAAVFLNIAGGVLLSNFLVELDASTVQIGTLAAIPMVVNLIQPLGAYLAGRTTSRHQYGLCVYGPSRLVWLVLACGTLLFTWHNADPQPLLQWALGVVLVSAVLSALGSASWLSWKAALVPRQLRGRYFGFRNSAISLTTLICVPLAGLGVSTWPGGTIQGYGVLLLLGVVAGLVSLGLQFFMKDVNPQLQHLLPDTGKQAETIVKSTELINCPQTESSIWRNTNFLIFLLYFGLWSFSINLSSPFFNIYLLDNLALDVGWVTLYNSLASGATLLMLVVWGRLSDRVGNRPLLLLVGILVALTPLLWLGISSNSVSLWVWLPLLHIFIGSTWAAIELCSNNIQMAIAPTQQHASYFAIAAAVAGGSGALGTVAGGFLAEADYGGLSGIFILSSILRLGALLPLVLVHERQRQSQARILTGTQPGLELPEKALELDELNRVSTVSVKLWHP